jgi:hypothetical protein
MVVSARFEMIGVPIHKWNSGTQVCNAKVLERIRVHSYDPCGYTAQTQYQKRENGKQLKVFHDELAE